MHEYFKSNTIYTEVLPNYIYQLKEQLRKQKVIREKTTKMASRYKCFSKNLFLLNDKDDTKI